MAVLDPDNGGAPEVLHGGAERVAVRWHELPDAPSRAVGLSLYRVRPGERCGLHVHGGKTETWLVVAGEAEVVRGEERLRVRVGDAVRTPPGVAHALANVGAGDVLFVNVVEPEPGVEPSTVELEDVP